MATYSSVPSSVPSPQRVALITSVASGDQIDLTDVLGRPARKIQFHMTDPSDSVDYTLNSLRKIRPQRTRDEAYTKADQVWGVYNKTEEQVWSDSMSSFSSTGDTVLETSDSLQISSIQIDALSLSTGTTIELVVW